MKRAPAVGRLAALSLLGLSLGTASACVISVNEGGGWWEEDAEQCYDDYDDCLDDAENPDEAQFCADALDECLANCGKADGGGDDEAGEDDGEPPREDEGGDAEDDGGAEDGGAEDGGAEDGGEDTGGEPEPDPACYDILSACIDAAETLQDVEACEALFDNCIDPGPCDDPMCEEPECPQELLDACVADYGLCSEAAATPEDVVACGEAFDACVSEFDVSLCLPNYDDELLEACLEQHALCTACAPDAEGLAACQSTFDNCLEG